VSEAERAVERVAALRRIGRCPEAERSARDALAGRPQHAGLLRELSATLLSLDRPADGLAAAEAAAAAEPENERAHLLRALHLSALGRHPEAVWAGYQAVTLAPEEPYAALGYATVLRAAGRLADALATARRAVELSPTLVDAHLILARVHDTLGHSAAARAAYEEVLRLEPDHALARHDLAVQDLRGNRAGAALRGLLDAGALDPTIDVLVRNVGAVLWRVASWVRAGLIVATIAVLASIETGPAAVRTVAAVVLVAAVVAGVVARRRLPASAPPALLAALRADVLLVLTYLVSTAGLGVLVLVLVTGRGELAALNWPVVIALVLLAVLVSLVRRARRR
jgi:tetratricopeptide (TPR) repeat protein